MIYGILIVIVVVLLLGGFMIRRQTLKRGLSYVPDPNALGNVTYNPGEIPKVTVATPEFHTEEIALSEFRGDMSDDLLDPNNPRHAEWVKEHPEMESDAEWTAEHPEDNPS